MNLITYKQLGIKKVKIISAKDVSCSKCSKVNDTTYIIDDAIKEMPLPNRVCEFHLHKGKFAFLLSEKR